MDFSAPIKLNMLIFRQSTRQVASQAKLKRNGKGTFGRETARLISGGRLVIFKQNWRRSNPQYNELGYNFHAGSFFQICHAHATRRRRQGLGHSGARDSMRRLPKPGLRFAGRYRHCRQQQAGSKAAENSTQCRTSEHYATPDNQLPPGNSLLGRSA